MTATTSAGGADPATQSRRTADKSLESFVQKLTAHSADASLLVVDLSDLRVLASLNPRQSMIPASNQKIFVMAAALDMLGPQFAFETTLATDGQSLIVVGDGDPGFGDPRLAEKANQTVTTPLEQWAQHLKSRGATEFSGDLIIDESIFDEQRTHPSWSPRELQKWYAAPVGGLNINDNCIDVTVWPGVQIGDRPRISIEPPSPIVQIENLARTASKGVPVIGRVGETFNYRLSQKCGKRATLESVAVPDGGLLFAHSFKKILVDNGMTIRGDVKRQRVRMSDGSLPAKLNILAKHQTPLTDVLARVGQNSQNFFADCLAKRIGYEHQHRSGHRSPQGSWASAGVATESLLKNVGIATNGFTFSDGSGLSRDNRATVTQIVGVLTHMHRHSSAEMFRQSLAVPGEDGSLRRRMRHLSDRVHAKTGTLRQVRTLAGYVDDTQGRTYAFAIFFNNAKGKSQPYKAMQDELCQLLADRSGDAAK